MTSEISRRILTINSGSSSLKMALYEMGRKEERVLSAHLDRAGTTDSRLRITDARGEILLERPSELPDHAAAVEIVFKWLDRQPDLHRLDAVGHRIVHGGSLFIDPQLITPEMMESLQNLSALDPDHLSQAANAINATGRAHPNLLQVACFDTAFHRSMPEVARLHALPRRYRDEGIVRYGFHGLSYEYITQQLRAIDGQLAEGRVVVAHLGYGASMAAIRGGQSVDTTMGFTPESGLVMGTRSGDLDSGVLIYLQDKKAMTSAEVNTLINKQGGLLGVSGISSDMRELLRLEDVDQRAADAVDLFCYRAKKYLGAYAAALGGLDILVFTGGIGEHAPQIRERICSGLEWLGICIDPARNQANASVISREDSHIRVRVMRTDEELMIARHVVRLISRASLAKSNA